MFSNKWQLWRWMDILPLTQETTQEDNNYCLIASRRWMMGICAILISIPNFGKRKLSETLHRAETIYRATQNMKWPWFCRRPLTLSHKLTQPIHSKTDPHTLGKNHFREKWLILWRKKSSLLFFLPPGIVHCNRWWLGAIWCFWLQICVNPDFASFCDQVMMIIMIKNLDDHWSW